MEMTERRPSFTPWKSFPETLCHGAVIYGLYALFFLLSSYSFSMFIFHENRADDAGTIFCLAALFSTPPAILLLFFFAGKTKEAIQEVLGLYTISLKEITFSGLMALLLFGLYHSLSVYMCGGTVPEPVITLWRTTDPGALFFITMLLAVPVFEEFFFRGFLFHCFARTPLGKTGATLSTALLWSLGHLQYEMWDMGVLFFVGMILAFFRIRSGSLYPSLFFHLIVNLGTSLELAIFY